MQNTIIQRDDFWEMNLRIHLIFFLISENPLERGLTVQPHVSAEIHWLSGEKRKCCWFLNSKRMLWFLVSSEQAIKEEFFLNSMTDYVRSKYPVQNRDHVWYKGAMQLPQALLCQPEPLVQLKGRTGKIQQFLKIDLHKAGFWLQTCSVG